MLSKQFIAKTRKGIEIVINAENTEKKLTVDQTVKCIPTKQGALFVVALDVDEVKSLLGVTIPAGQQASIVLEDQAGWKRFKEDCDRERYEIEEAKPKSLQEQRERLASDEYNLYSPEHFPGSEAWHRWNDATIALAEFDAAHPEVKENLKVTDDGFIPTEGGMDLDY